MLRNEKLLLTGPTSVVAFPIARELAKHNEVYGLARFRSAGDRARLEALGVTCIAADLACDSFDAVPDDFTYVLHFGVARTDHFEDDLAVNAEGPGRLMRHCRRAKAWLQCSTVGVYEPAEQPLKETDPLGDSHRGFMPTYSICKIAAEVVARLQAREHNLPTTIARLGVPYGPNGGWPAWLLDAMVGSSPITVRRNKPNLFNPIYEDDYIAQVPKLLAVAAVPAVTINWAGEPVSIEEWCGYIAQLTGLRPTFEYVEEGLSLVLDLTRMHELIGRTTVDWHDGIRRMIQARHPELLK